MNSDDVPWLDDDEAAAWVQLIKLASRLVALADTELRRAGSITGKDYELLHHLSTSRDGWRVNELAELIDDSSSCVTHRVNRLGAAGLVAKRPDANDQRARRVRLTSAGRDLLAHVAPDHARRVRRWVIDPLDRDDLAALARLAGTLNTHLRSTAPVCD